jgi:hypothetical protein
MEQLFVAYLEAHQATDPLATEALLRRSGLLFARFRLNVTSGSIENLVEHFSTDPPRDRGTRRTSEPA